MAAQFEKLAFEKLAIRWEWLIYKMYKPDQYDNPWLCPTFKLVGAFHEKKEADKFADRASTDGKSYYHVQSGNKWEGGGSLKEPTIKIPFELFRKMVVCMSHWYKEELRIELMTELNAFIEENHIRPSDYVQP